MPQAIMILLDNSQYSINGDYTPTRWNSQIDCVGLLIQAKMEQDHQMQIGLGLMAGKQTQIICTPTNDSAKVSAYLYGNNQNGLLHFTQSLQIAALALKHRSDSTLRQRIIIFVASTITDNPQQIRIIGKRLKKNQIAVDIIAIGDTTQQQKTKLNALYQSVCHQQNSSIKIIEPGNIYLSDILIGSSLFGGGDQGGFSMINQQDDPELAMALKMSLEQANKGKIEIQKVQQATPGNQNIQNIQDLDEQQLQRKALQLSLQDNPTKGNDKKDDHKDKDKDDTMKGQ